VGAKVVFTPFHHCLAVIPFIGNLGKDVDALDLRKNKGVREADST
jgi:hypothetical protein